MLMKHTDLWYRFPGFPGKKVSPFFQEGKKPLLVEVVALNCHHLLMEGEPASRFTRFDIFTDVKIKL